MELPKTYDPILVEDKWYKYWLDQKYFKSVPDDRKPYTIVIPPPNVTGILHMGHVLNNTIQDILIRKARMQGFNACWVPGTDHASIATEAKVVNKLRESGVKKSDLSRDEFLKHAWEWTDEHGGIILQQLKKLGASCDWDRVRFTMDEKYYDSVIDTFIDLYNKGKIYRGKRMIHWDPVALTALSDEEVIYKELESQLYYVRYPVVGENDQWVTIATTRPETILGDTAVCIHPEDERYKHLHGKRVKIPMVEREVPIIMDEYVDPEFGTGCLKVTPAHDTNDYELGIKHNLEVVDILNPNGTMSEAAQFYIGEDRFKVRKKIVADLDKEGNLVKTESYPNKVGYSERTDAVIEPRLSWQWFVEMEELSKPALENVLNGNIDFYPEKLKNAYRNWMENVRDWCISRQLWWGHRIPAWFYGEGEEDFVVAKTAEEALEKAKEKTGKENFAANDLKQDEDVVDTWFSSWLWPISVFDGFYKKDEIDYYYPTNDLVTAPEIMFFWVARMIISGYEYRGEKPFSNVYYTGIVRDKLGRKMSKSLGNSPDPIELINKYGADGIRVGMLLTSPAGNDLPFDVKLCEQGRNFANKIWNAFRLVKSWEIENKDTELAANIGNRWMSARFNEVLEKMDKSYEKFRISEVLMLLYKHIWDDFCSWYLEIIKPTYGDAIDSKTYDICISYFENILKILHPFMPFITEEIWQAISDRSNKEALVITEWPVKADHDDVFLSEFELAQEVVSAVRSMRKEKNISPKVALKLFIKSGESLSKELEPMILKMANLESIDSTEEKVPDSFSFLIKTMQAFIPFEEEIDIGAEIDKIKSELAYTKGFLNSVDKKLSNDKFVNNAPPNVVQIEKTKRDDAASKIKLLEDKLSELQN